MRSLKTAGAFFPGAAMARLACCGIVNRCAEMQDGVLVRTTLDA